MCTCTCSVHVHVHAHSHAHVFLCPYTHAHVHVHVHVLNSVVSVFLPEFCVQNSEFSEFGVILRNFTHRIPRTYSENRIHGHPGETS